MTLVQPIILNNRLVAIVAGGQAIIHRTLDPGDASTVKAMCLFAIDAQRGALPGPYSEARALAYARRAAAARLAAATGLRGTSR